MHRPRARICRLLALLLALACASPAALSQVGPADDPLPLRRVVVPSQRVAAELEKVRRGTLVQMPRAAFEERVRKARQAAAARRDRPRLARASYTAELVGDALTSGSGQWDVRLAGPVPDLLPLGGLNLALHRAKWDHGAEAVLGDLDGTGPTLLLERAGPASCFFDWSARGTETTAGLTFALHLPICPTTLLELKLPADRWLAVPRLLGALVTGPLDSESPVKKLWRVQVTGASVVELTVRRVSADGGPPARLFAQAQARQFLAPGRATAEFEFQVEALHAAVRELVFEGDPGLEPFEVTARGGDLKGWQWTAPAKGGPGLLTVPLREPLQGTLASLRVRCLAPAPAAGWVSPSLRLRHAQVRGETLQLQVHPDLSLGRWDAGDFHLASGRTEADGTLVLTLHGQSAGIPAARRPRCALAAPGPELHTAESVRWHFGPRGVELTAEIRCELSRGALHQLALRLPRGGPRWQVDAVETTPKDALRSWTAAGPLLLLDFQRGLTPRGGATVKVSLRVADGRRVGGPRVFELPDLEPLGAATRSGTLNVTADPLYRVELLQAKSVPVAPQGPAVPTAVPHLRFDFRGTPARGQVRVVPRPPRLRVRAATQIRLDGSTGRVRCQLDVEPLIGSAAALELRVSAPVAGRWQVQTEGGPPIRQVCQRRRAGAVPPQLLLLGTPNPLGQAALLLLPPAGQTWRVEFVEPVTRRLTLVLEAPFAPLDEAGTHWVVPIVTVPGASEFEGEIVVDAADRQIDRAMMAGVRALSPTPGGAAARFRLREPSSGRSPALRLVTRLKPAAAAAHGAVCDQVRLTSTVRADGAADHRLEFALCNWPGGRFPVRLPGGAELRAARLDGRLLTQVDRRADADGLLVRLPVGAAATVRHCELFYQTRPVAAPAPGLARQEDAVPTFPMRPLALTHRWVLAPGLIPLHRDRYRRVGLPAPLQGRPSPAAALRTAWHLGDDWLGAIVLAEDVPEADAVREALRAAEAIVRRDLTAATSFGEALQRWQDRPGDGRGLLVLDRAGLAAAGVRPQTPLGAAFTPGAGRPFWEALDLVLIPCRGAAVLTTRAAARRWEQYAGGSAARAEALAGPTAAALCDGADAPGELASLTVWLHDPGPESDLAETSPGTAVSGDDADWTVWESLPGVVDPSAFWVVDTAAARIAGWAVALLVGAVALLSYRRLSAVWHFRTQGLGLLLVGVVGLWLPAALRDHAWWPIVLVQAFACGAAFLALGRADLRGGGRSTAPRGRPVAVAALLVLAGLPLLGLSQAPAPEPAWVLLVGDGAEQSALVPPELLQRLDALERRTPLADAGAVLVAARYQGKVNGAEAVVAAQFEFHSFRDRATLRLPLIGVQLREGVFLDGAPVFPVADRTGYALPIRGKGAHTLRLTFAARTAGTPERPELRFGVPPLALSEATFTWTAPARSPELVRCRGEERVSGSKRRGPELHARLGAVDVLHLRWQPATSPPGGGRSATVREAYSWDLRPAATALTAALQYVPGKAPLSHFDVLIPPGLEVRAVEVAATGAGAATPPSLRTWRLDGREGQPHMLRVELTQPHAGPLRCVVELLPRLSLGAAELALRLPTPLGVRSADGQLAYRLEGADAGDRAQDLAVTNVASDQFTRLWTALAGRTAGPITRAYSFRRTGGAAGLVLGLRPQLPAGAFDATWDVRPEFADLTARVTLRADAGDLSLVELLLPSTLTLASVEGPALHHWERAGNRLQVWLARPGRRITLQIRGWVRHGFHPGRPPARLDLPALALAGIRPETSRVQVRAVAGLQLIPEKLAHLTPAPGGEPLSYTTEQGNYVATFRLRAAPVAPEAWLLTAAEARGDEADLCCSARVSAPGEGPLTFVLSDWPGAAPRLDVEPAPTRVVYRRAGATHEWTVTPPRGLSAPLIASACGRAPLRRGEPLRLPTLKLARAADRGRWVVVRGLDVQPSHSPGAVAAQVWPDAWRFGPGAAPPGGQVWMLTGPKAHVTVALPAPVAAAQTRVTLARQEASWDGAGRWLHEIACRVDRRDRNELHVVLPADAELLAAAVDGRLVAPLVQETGGASRAIALLVPLPEGRAPCTVRVRWDYPAGIETPTQPRRMKPRLPGCEVLDSQARVRVPAGYRLAGPRSTRGAFEAEALYGIAQSALRESAWLAAPGAAGADTAGGTPLLAAQRHFRVCLRRLEASADALAAMADGPDPAPLRDKAVKLRRENATTAERLKYEPTRRAAAGASLLDVIEVSPLSPLRPGAIYAWSDEATEAAGALPVRSLLDDEQTERRTYSELLLLAALSLLLLSALRSGLALARLLWPEVLAGLTLAGALAWGPSLPAALLLAVAAAGRLLWIARRARRRPRSARSTSLAPAAPDGARPIA